MTNQRIGNQSPTFEVVGPYTETDGPECCALMSALRMPPDPWERHILDVWLSRAPAGHFAFQEHALAVPRQNGKTWLVRAVCIYLTMKYAYNILFSAHQVKTTKKSFEELSYLFMQTPELRPLVRNISHVNGEQGIFLKNGGSIEFAARTKSTNRGFTVDICIFDEAQEYTSAQQEATELTLSASPHNARLIIYLGTPPGPGVLGDVFPREHNLAHSDYPDMNATWIEWAATEIGDPTDVDRWYRYNPGMGLRLTEDWTRRESQHLRDDGFARERLGWWSSDSTYIHALPAGAWEECGTDDASDVPQDGEEAYGVKFDPNGNNAALSAAVLMPDGRVYVELISLRDITHGTGWLTDFLVKNHENPLSKGVWMDGKGVADNMQSRLHYDFKIPRSWCHVCSTQNITSISEQFKELVASHKILHYNQYELTNSAIHASRRKIGNYGGWGFGTVGEYDSTAVESAAIAVAAVLSKHSARHGAKVRTW